MGGESEEAGYYQYATLTPNTPGDETSPCLFRQQKETLISFPWQPKFNPRVWLPKEAVEIMFWCLK